MDQKEALEKAIRHFGGHGANVRLARAVGVSPMAVSHWRKQGVPIERCPDIEIATGGKVTRADLRPDIFGDLELSA